MSEHARPHPDLAGYVLGVLEPGEAIAFEEHLQRCAECRDEVSALSRIPGLLDLAAPPTTPPPALRHRTLRAVDRDAARTRQLRLSGAALAAVAAVVLILMVVVRPFSQDPFTIDLVAARDSDASGVALVTASPYGLRIDMRLRDLPPSPPGTHYECWYVAAGGDDAGRVTGGTFVAPDGGDVDVTMFTAADPIDYPLMDVTLEPDDGNPARTGVVVLTSTQ